QCFKTDAGFQIICCIGQGFQLVIGCHHIGVGIGLALLALGIRGCCWKKTGAMARIVSPLP
ncbi:hypothetical protein, partial [Thiolapillus sp.]|uniref:hypothetical protein n=1 Tax=Thiolapillus sp. TaxID=2017437 RepID=UPI003AF73D80